MTVTSQKRHFPVSRQYISTIGPLKKGKERFSSKWPRWKTKVNHVNHKSPRFSSKTWFFPRHALGLQFRSDLITALPWCGPWLPGSLWSKLGNNGTWRSHGSHGYGGATNGVMMAGPCSPLKCWKEINSEGTLAFGVSLDSKNRCHLRFRVLLNSKRPRAYEEQRLQAKFQ